jgi:hypothetical protein
LEFVLQGFNFRLKLNWISFTPRMHSNFALQHWNVLCDMSL